jgi:hypothetical protein
MINTIKLHKELKAAGIKFSGCDSSGRVVDLQGVEIQDRKDVQALITNHDPELETNSSTVLKDISDVGVSKDDLLLALWKSVVQADAADAAALQEKIDLAGLT